MITTATDVSGKFAVDVFAAENSCAISDRRLAKEISAAVLAGERIPLLSDFPLEGEFPREIYVCKKSAAGGESPTGRVGREESPAGPAAELKEWPATCASASPSQTGSGMGSCG